MIHIHRPRNEQELERWHRRRIAEIKRDNEYYKLLAEQEQLKKKYKKKVSSAKLAMAFIFINCTLIEAFSIHITYRALSTLGILDLSAILGLISAVVGESVAYVVYCAKSKHENTKGGIVYDMAMAQLDNDNDAKYNECENNDDANDNVDNIDNGACG